MAKYDIKLIDKLAKKEGMKLKLHYWETETQRIYDYDVSGSNVGYRRMKLVTFKNGNKIFPDSANVYVGESAKYGFRFDSYEELIKKLKNFKWK